MKIKLLSKLLLVSSMLLIIISVLRLLSLSVWSSLTDLINGFYAMFIYVLINRMIQLNEEGAGISAPAASYGYPMMSVNNAIFDNIVCFGIFMLINVILGVFTLVSLSSGEQPLGSNLQEWQIISGIVVAGIALVVYFSILVIIFLCYRELKALSNESNDPFSRTSGRPGMPPSYPSASNNASFGAYVFGSSIPAPPTGKYSTQNQSSATNQTNRFPGQGRSLKEDEESNAHESEPLMSTTSSGSKGKRGMLI